MVQNALASVASYSRSTAPLSNLIRIYSSHELVFNVSTAPHRYLHAESWCRLPTRAVWLHRTTVNRDQTNMMHNSPLISANALDDAVLERVAWLRNHIGLLP